MKINLLMYFKSESEYLFYLNKFNKIDIEYSFVVEANHYYIKINLENTKNCLFLLNDFSFENDVNIKPKISIGYWFSNDYGGFKIPEFVIKIAFKFEINIDVSTYILY